MKSILFLTLASVFTITSLSSFAHLPFCQKPQEESKQEEKKMVLPTDEHTVARRDFMRTKLLYSQNMLEGLTTGNFELIDRSLSEINRVTEGEHWIAIDNDKYRKLTDSFKTAVKDLQEASSSKSIEATTLRYYQMCTSCIDCHQHIRKAEYEL